MDSIDTVVYSDFCFLLFVRGQVCLWDLRARSPSFTVSPTDAERKGEPPRFFSLPPPG